MRTSTNHSIAFAISAAASLAIAGCGTTDGRSGDQLDGEHAGTVSSALATTNDLTIGYIQRLPVMNWVLNSTSPQTDGWPTVGQSVTWRGFVRNFSSTARSNVQYKWTWDGVQVASGTVSIAANGTATVDYVRAWDFARHNLKLSIDTTNAVAEDEEQNNDLTVVTNAISLGLWVEQSLYNYFLAHQRELAGAHSTCWDNWAQRQVGYWDNTLYPGAVYPETPNGVLDRVRLDKITIVPDGALPLNGGLPTNDPDLNDHTVDLEWGYPSTLLPPGSTAYADTATVSLSNSFYYEQSLPHELGHARYLIDDYGFNVHQQPDGTGRDGIPQTENGAGIVGTPFLPMVRSDAVYLTHQSGLMNGDNYLMVDLYSTMALNLIAGDRAVNGNVNAPGNFGAFLNDLPAQNQVTLRDASNNAPLAGAEVRIYQSTANGQLYGKNFSSTPAQVLTTDANGNVLVGHNPFTSGSLSPWHDNTDIMLRVEQQNRVRYVFMEASDYNLEFFRGHTSLGTYTLNIAFQPGAVMSSNPVLGFESPSYWTTTAGTLSSVSSPITEGSAALQISGVGYATLQSAAVTSAQVTVGSRLAFDLLLPQFENGSWYGQTQVYLNSPSRGVYGAYIGSQNLTGLPLETYNTITMTLPASVASSLEAGSFNDLTIQIVLDLPGGSGRHLLDNFRFLP
jgi:hypothetical protein